jgi:hypothetical protein
MMRDGNTQPALLYAGNSRLRQQVVEIVGDEAELRVVNNVRPTLDTEQLMDAQQELNTLFVQRKMEQLPGFLALTTWSPVPVTPTNVAFGRLIQYLWHLGDPARGVMGIDVGASNTTVAAVFGGHLHLTTHGELGSALGGRRLVESQGMEAVTRWLPEPIPSDETRGLLITKELFPNSIPQAAQELWIEQAIAREAIRATLETARPGWRPGPAQPYAELMPLCDTIVVTGGALTGAPQPGLATLILLDAVQPIGVCTIVLDAYGLTPALGSVAAVKPLAAVEALDAGGFTNLATVVAPVGQTAPGDPVLRVKVRHGQKELDVEVCYGDLETVPLPLGQEAVLELSPERGFDIGLGGPGKGGSRRVSGGLAGLIIDARGRPLPLPQGPEKRLERVRQWLYDVGQMSR